MCGVTCEAPAVRTGGAIEPAERKVYTGTSLAKGEYGYPVADRPR